MNVLSWVGAVLLVLLGLYVAAIIVNAGSMIYFYRTKLAPVVPGPPGHWLFGNALLFKKHNREFIPVLNEVLSQYGPVAVFRMLFRPVVLVADMDAAHTIWLTKNFPKRGLYDSLRYMFGNGLVTADGETWKAHRKLLSAGFTPQSLRHFVPAFQQHADELVSAIRRDMPAGAEWARLRIDRYLTECTLDVIATTALRYPLNALRGQNPDIAAAFTRILTNSTASPILMLPFGGLLQRLRLWRVFRIVDRVIDRAIDRAMQDRPVPGAAPRDLMDVLLGTSQPLSRQEIHDELFIFFLAGHETTALTLTWCLHELTLNPDVMQRLRGEIRQVCGDAMPTVDQLSQLSYMTNVLKETLRLHEPVAALSRTLTEDLRIGDIVLPAKTNVMVSMETIHKNPKVWPDPYRFDPDRFTEENSAGRHPFAWVPFTHGPRICIGQHFFMMEAKVLLTRLLQCFEFAAVPGFEVVPTSRAGTLKPKNGLELRVRARHPASS